MDQRSDSRNYAKVHFEIGERVKKGDLIAEIEN